MNTAKEQVESFFKPDFVSSPNYRGDPSSALDLLKLRMDSRGQPVRRTFIGNTESFYDGIKLRNSKQEIINQAGLPRRKKLPHIGPIGKMESTKNMVDSIFDKNDALDQINSMSTFRGDVYASHLQSSNFKSIGSTPRKDLPLYSPKALIDSRKRNLSVGFSTIHDGKAVHN